MKRYLINGVLLICYTITLYGCSSADTMRSNYDQQVNLISERKFIEERIKLFTKDEFRFVKDTELRFVNETVYFETSFTPEVGSFPVKNDIMREVAIHAVTIRRFFPEIVHYKYTVLAGYKDPRTALVLTIDQKATEALFANYYGDEIDKNGGIKPDYRNVFSKIEETDVGRGWRFDITPDSKLP